VSSLPRQLTAAESRLILAGDAEFAETLRNQVRARPGNLVYSPASVRIALSMVAAGAHGATADELDSVLALGLNPENASAAFAGVLAAWSRPADGETLRVADSVWANKGLELDPTFLGAMQNDYGAPVQTIDFAGDPAGARATINRTVAKQTEDRIKDLVPERAITADTRLVLTNAILFKSRWRHPFRKEATRPGPFKLAADKSVDVPMLTDRRRALYGEAGGMKVLELPYASGRTTMLILLPNDVDGLATLEEQPLATRLFRLRGGTKLVEVDIAVPKVELRATLSLTEALGKVLPTTFAKDKADLTGIAPKERLFVSDVVHQGYLKIDEDGTEAAAATAVIAPTGMGAAKAPAKAFIADHPFAFAILDTESISVLFLGRVVDPR
jgi:serpin B